MIRLRSPSFTGSRRKILTQKALAAAVRRWQSRDKTVVFTNGCFDILHAGHVCYLEAARRLGDALAVGVNSDRSIRRIKGAGRPVNRQSDRLMVLAALECIDHLCLFEAETPLQLIRRLSPDILVKGGDWSLDQIVGREWVEGRGGRVMTIPLLPGVSTTGLIEKLRGTA